MATIYDIAKRAEVDPKTVSNILNERYRAKHPNAVERAERIRRIAREMKYRPNVASRAIRTGRFENVAALLPLLGSSAWFPRPLIVGLMRALSQHGVGLQMAELPPADAVLEGVVPEFLLELSTDGLVMLSGEAFPAEIGRQIDCAHLPVVWANHNGPTDCVYPAEREGARLLTEKVVRRGHERVALVSVASSGRQKHGHTHFSADARRAGFEDVMRGAGLSPAQWRITPMVERAPLRGVDARRLEFRGLLGRSDRPTALVVTDSEAAVQIMGVASEMALRVPTDLSVVTVAAGPFHEPHRVLTRVSVPWREMGAAAATMLTKKIGEGGGKSPSIELPLSFREGETLGPPTRPGGSD